MLSLLGIFSTFFLEGKGGAIPTNIVGTSEFDGIISLGQSLSCELAFVKVPYSDNL
jgi:hypothetical protein